MTFPETSYFLKLTPHYAENCKEKNPMVSVAFFVHFRDYICPKYILLIIILNVF